MTFSKRSSIAVLLLVSAPAARAELPRDGFGVISQARGDVTLDGKDARDLDPVKAGAVIRTGSDGKVTVLLRDHKVVHLDSGTNVKVTESSTGGEEIVDLASGRVRALVRNEETPSRKARFRIQTKTAVMGVRGTHVYVASGDSGEAATFLTIEGEADVRSPEGSTVTLRTNQLLEVTKGADLAKAAPKAIDASESRELAREVAPPAEGARTQGELEQVEEGGDFSEPSVEAVPDDFARNLAPPLDPVANGGGGSIPIGVKFGD